MPPAVKSGRTQRHLSAAVKLSEQLEEYADAGDVIELSNIGFELRNVLSNLWDLRGEREDDWGDLLNLLQIALTQEEFERFSPKQCRAISVLVRDHLGSGVADREDVEHAIAILETVGFDPWKGISSSRTTGNGTDIDE